MVFGTYDSRCTLFSDSHGKSLRRWPLIRRVTLPYIDPSFRIAKLHVLQVIGPSTTYTIRLIDIAEILPRSVYLHEMARQ